MIRALLAAFLSLGIGSLFGGGSSGGSSNFTPYSPTGLSQADQTWQSLLAMEMANMFGPGTATRQVSGILGPAYNKENAVIAANAPQLQAAGLGAGAYLENMAGQADAFHNLMTDQYWKNVGMEGGLTNAGNTVWNTAADPQQALFNQLQQQVTDQSRAATSARGIGVSPEAAGIENKALSDFDINWQNQQLQREISGLGALGQAYTQAGKQGEASNQDLVASQAMSALAPQLIMQGVQVPYQSQMQPWQDYITTANNYIAAQEADQWGPAAAVMSQIIPYMNYGAGAQANAFNAGQSNLSNLFSLGGLLTNGFGGGAGGFANSPLAGLAGMFGGSMFGGGLADLFGGTGAAAGAGDLLDLGFMFA